MSYLDRKTSPGRVWALAVVALLHVLLGYALVMGFYQRFTKEGVKDLDVFDVAEEPPPEEEPPPPEELPPPSPEMVTPPPIVPRQTPPTPQPPQTDQIPDQAPMNPRPDPPRPDPPRPDPPPQTVRCPGGQVVNAGTPCPAPTAAPTVARLRSGSISNNDYPAAAERANAQGTTRITLAVGADGSVTGCTVSGSSGNGALDSTACNLARRRFRFTPATRNGQPVAGSYSQSVRWVLPEDN